jgi:hypothetical protein
MRVVHHYFANGITYFTQRISLECERRAKLLLNGYTLWRATYNLGEYKEGVSVTVIGELEKWQK